MGYDPGATRRLGSAPLEVTQLGLGCGPLGGFRRAIPEHEADAIVRTAYDAGVRLFDTSPLYGYGRSELRVGHVLRQVPRDSFVLSTKVGHWLTPRRPGQSYPGLRAGGLEFVPTYDLSYDGVMRALEQSCCRLGLATVDILLIHDLDAYTHGREAFERHYREALDGAYPALDELRRAGVIKAVGIGVNEVEPCLRFARDADLDCILLAGRYTLLEQGALDELLPLSLEKRIGILLGGPFNSGILAGGATEGATYNYKPAPPEVIERVRRIEAVCRRHAVPLAAAALQFPLAHPAISTMIPGALNRAEVLENAAAVAFDIPAAFWAELKHGGCCTRRRRFRPEHAREHAPLPLTLEREAAAATGRGIACALVAWLLFACMDAGSKLLAEQYSIVQILWVRFLSLLAVSGSLALRQGSAGLITRRFWLQSLRSLMLMIEIGLFIWTITVLPLADAHAILAIAPLMVTALSVPLLGEKVGIRRWTAVGVASLGMLIILRPGFGVMHPMALVALLCAGMWSLYQVLTRVVSRTDAPITTLFYTALIGAVALTVIGPFYWRTPDAVGWALFALVAVLGASGHFLLIKALQLAPASVLQPFAYTVLVWATLVGFTVFGNLPDRYTVAGALIIVASGLYAFARERRLRRV